jgi:GTP 3',8-cyclase
MYPLTDRYGRTAVDLRVSLTDRCNLRCVYCMPAEGLPWLPREEMLSDDELVRLVSLSVSLLGIRKIRLTGGEPLIRPGVVGLVERVAALRMTSGENVEVSLTTNGLGLTRMAGPLAGAGLQRVNVSLDTVDAETFATLTRRDRLRDVLAGLAAARDAGLAPVKVNAVLMRGVNDHQAPDLLAFCLREGYQLRIIEQMPLDAQHGWTREGMVTAEETLARLREHVELVALAADERGAAPAELFEVVGHRDASGAPATVGVIASVSSPFCAACDRSRLTADGQLRTCLFATEESDLRAPMRAGASDDEIARRWQVAMVGKKAGHGIDDPGFLQPLRPMSSIGG